MIYDIFKTSFLNIWPSIVIIAVTLISVRFAFIKHHRQSAKFYKEFWAFIGIIYMLLLYQLVTRVDVNVASGYNMVPFKEIMRYEFNSKMFYYNVLGNIALFMPFGFIVAYYVKPKRIWTNAIIAILVSTTIEIVQLNIGRSFDIDDILLNTIGCMIGYVIYKLCRAVYGKLPNVLKSDWLNNLICIIIMAIAGIYVLKVAGIV